MVGIVCKNMALEVGTQLLCAEDEILKLLSVYSDNGFANCPRPLLLLNHNVSCHVMYSSVPIEWKMGIGQVGPHIVKAL